MPPNRHMFAQTKNLSPVGGFTLTCAVVPKVSPTSVLFIHPALGLAKLVCLKGSCLKSSPRETRNVDDNFRGSFFPKHSLGWGQNCFHFLLQWLEGSDGRNRTFVVWVSVQTNLTQQQLQYCTGGRPPLERRWTKHVVLKRSVRFFHSVFSCSDANHKHIHQG